MYIVHERGYGVGTTRIHYRVYCVHRFMKIFTQIRTFSIEIF